jgi:ABC-2 type transport system ATP-binding protein
MSINRSDIIISIQGLKKNYGNFTAVDGLSVDIYRNEIFGLLGPNGAGKTTTISMICGLLPPSAGNIRYMGSGRENFDKSLIGYCPQENIYYPKLTCLEQLVFIAQAYGFYSVMAKPKALELLEMLGLKDKKNVLASKLSGGMKRRLNICLALIHDPEILILDEPEAGLDPQSRILVREFIKSFGKEKTIILTTHNMDEADRLADRIAIIDHGKLLMLDTAEKMKKTIGEGDLLEIILGDNNIQVIDKFIGTLGFPLNDIQRTENTVVIKHPDIIDKLAAIKIIADGLGLMIDEYKLRTNTLEDVFIYLTGRSLRQ